MKSQGHLQRFIRKLRYPWKRSERDQEKTDRLNARAKAWQERRARNRAASKAALVQSLARTTLAEGFEEESIQF